MAFDASQFMYNSGSSDYEITNSLRLENGDSAYLSQTLGTATNNDKATFSCWTKRGNLSGNDKLITRFTDANNRFYIAFAANNKLYVYSKISGTTEIALYSTQIFSDITAWYHVLVAMDTTQGTASNRIKIYVNGTRITAFDTETYPDQNQDLILQSATNTALTIGSYDPADVAQFYDGYMAEINFIDGAQKAPADFGETGDYGEWKPIKYAGTYGDNGYHLDFKSSGVGTAGSGTVGADRSGNTNHWTSTNIVVTDQMLDSPTNNFATWNPVNITTTNPPSFAEGNLQVTTPNNGAGCTVSTMGVTSGKWYAEILPVSYTSLPRYAVAITGDAGATIRANTNIGSLTSGFDVGYFFNGTRFVGNTETADWGATYAAGDIIGVALNADDNEVTFYKNNSSQGAISFTAGGTYHFAYGDVSAGGGGPTVANYGQDSSFAGAKTAQGNQDGNAIGDFYYAPPSGFLALCTNNLPDVAVIPSEHFNTVSWAGNGADDRSISGVGFQPDFVWNKAINRAGGDGHYLYDAIRGATKVIYSNATNAEATEANALQAFESDGFQMGSDSNSNSSSYNYVAWNWKAATAFSNDASATSVGSIDSAGKVNVAAGFSIIGWAGTGSAATIAHGLSKAPEQIWVKNRNKASQFAVYYGDNTDYLALNDSDATADYAGYWNDTSPTSTVFSVGSDGDVHGASNQNVIAYCFHSVDGYSKVGSYVANGNEDGAFVYLGFRPAFLLRKKSNATGYWIIQDNKRPGFNTSRNNSLPTNQNVLYANTNGAEVYNNEVSFLSNGFKATATDAFGNTDGATIEYYAVAETPFKYSNAR